MRLPGCGKPIAPARGGTGHCGAEGLCATCWSVEQGARAPWESQAAPLRGRCWEDETDAEKLDFRYAAQVVLKAAYP